MATFTVAGRSVTLTVDDVATALRSVAPEPIQKHGVEVEGRLYPVIQALEAASGVPRAETRSKTATMVFTALGMRLVQLGPGGQAPPPRAPTNTDLNAAISKRAQAASFAKAPLDSAAASNGGCDRMHAQPGHRVTGFDPDVVPTQPGVYAFYRDGEPVYVGRAIASGGLQRRMKTQHLKTGNDLSWSAFRRNVAEHLGIAPSTVTKQRPPQLTEEQVAPVNDWIGGCEVRWISCATEAEATQLEIDLKNEWKPPLTKR
ncbi:MAG TPA: hypothetical protein VNA57_06730 [Acidimicrobiales bacterium]|nr:hypothetical protein [Acidimicrobiales bacterium]